MRSACVGLESNAVPSNIRAFDSKDFLELSSVPFFSSCKTISSCLTTCRSELLMHPPRSHWSLRK